MEIPNIAENVGQTCYKLERYSRKGDKHFMGEEEERRSIPPIAD